MIRSLSLALGDLLDPRLLGIVVRSLIVTLLIFVGLGLLLAWALNGADPCAWLSDATCELGTAASGLGAFLLAVLLLWLLFPAVAIGVISAYMDRIIGLVETRHYPKGCRSGAADRLVGGSGARAAVCLKAAAL